MTPKLHQTPRPPVWLTRALVPLTLMLVLLSLNAPGASAHVEVDVGDGQYMMEIGFRDEPAFLGQPNAIFIHVEEYGTGGTEPVEGLAATLTAEVTKDGKTFSPALVPMGDGTYEGAFVPTEVGDYSFRISGTIGDATVDETVSSSPTTFNSVEPLSSIEFPVAQPDVAQFQADLQSAKADAAIARTLGIAGIAAGLLGLIVAAVAFARSGRSAPADAPATPLAAEPTSKLIR